MNATGPLVEQLTRREHDILLLLGQNLSNREIAERLVLSLHSVKWYLQHVYGKLGVANRKEAVIKARELGLLATVEAPTKNPYDNLPRQLTSFIGREKELDQVIRRVSEYPLVTLTGAGGVGKTRLAQAAARELLGNFANRVWYVELASLADPKLLAHTIADRIGVREEPDRSLLDSIVSYLNDRHALLVLDNCEHMVMACADLVQNLLTALPRMKVLSTSRQPLKVNGEGIFRVPSLTYPEDLPAYRVEDCLEFESVRLFVDRSRAALSSFQLTQANATSVAQICRRLDGVPLAIELAAARTRMMAVEEIAARLYDAFSLLTSGNQIAIPRHQTLKALIDWSYELLSPEEQALLLRLSVFAGGWTLEAAEQVCSDLGTKGISAASAAEQVCSDGVGESGPAGSQTKQIVELLGRLVDMSLVQFEPNSMERPQYHLLETVRQYASERLAECGGEARLRERHLDYYTNMAQKAGPHLRAAGSKYWLDRLGHELYNLRKALEWSLIVSQRPLSSSPLKGLQLATSLIWFWMIRSHHSEGMGWLERLLLEQTARSAGQPLDLENKAARVRALNVLTIFIGGARSPIRYPLLSLSREAIDQEIQIILHDLGDGYRREYGLYLFNHAQTKQDYMDCREIFLEVKDLFWSAECSMYIGYAYLPDFDPALVYAEENLVLRKEIGDIDGEGGAFHLLAMIEYYRGDLERTIALSKESIVCLDTVSDWEFAALFRGDLSTSYTKQGNFEESEQQIEFVRAAAQELNSKIVEYYLLRCQGYQAWMKGETELAIHYCGQALAFGKQNLTWWPFCFTPMYIVTRIALSRGELALARSYLKDILILEQQNKEPLVYTIHTIGIFAAMRGLMQQSATLFGAQDALAGWLIKTLFPLERSEYEQAVADARAALNDEVFTAAWEGGRAMIIEQVYAFALAVVDEKI